MPAPIALLLALQALLAVGLVVLIVGAVRAVVARRRAAGLRAPLIASGIGLSIALTAAVALLVDGAAHLTFLTFTASR